MKTDYLYTSIHESPDEILLSPNSTYIYGRSAENRSHFVEQLITRYSTNVFFKRIELLDSETIEDSNKKELFYLRSSKSIIELLSKHNSSTIYLDVTGLDNRICAALLKNALSSQFSHNKTIKIIYAEPEFYDIKTFNTESVFNNLSERIDGIFPLPGFATIFPQNDEEIFLIALLGFEGGRFSHLLENIQPARENVTPIIGVPGFRPEYPHVAYWSNKRPLEDTDTWRKIKFASANSLVEIYMLLSKLLRKAPVGSKFKVAPIGTKPHAIGAMLFAIKYPHQVELVYDNPKRKKSRTNGIGNILESDISELLKVN